MMSLSTPNLLSARYPGRVRRLHHAPVSVGAHVDEDPAEPLVERPGAGCTVERDQLGRRCRHRRPALELADERSSRTESPGTVLDGKVGEDRHIVGGGPLRREPLPAQADQPPDEADQACPHEGPREPGVGDKPRRAPSRQSPSAFAGHPRVVSPVPDRADQDAHGLPADARHDRDAIGSVEEALVVGREVAGSEPDEEAVRERPAVKGDGPREVRGLKRPNEWRAGCTLVVQPGWSDVVRERSPGCRPQAAARVSASLLRGVVWQDTAGATGDGPGPGLRCSPR